MGKLGKLSIVIGTVDKFSKGFRAAKQGLTSIKNAASSLFKGLAKLTAGFAALGAAITIVFKKSFGFIDNIGKIASRTGASTDLIQSFQLAALESGSSLEQANKALQKFSRSIGDAQRGLKTQVDVFEDLGIEVNSAAFKTLSFDEILRKTADGLQALGSEAERNTALANLFGRAGIELSGVLTNGSGAIDEFIDRSRRLGLILSEDAVRATEQFNDKLTVVGFQFRALRDNITTAFIPSLTLLIDKFGALLAPENEDDLEKLGKTIKNVFFDTILSATATLGELVKAFQLVVLKAKLFKEEVIAIGNFLMDIPFAPTLFSLKELGTLFDTATKGVKSFSGAVAQKVNPTIKSLQDQIAALENPFLNFEEFIKKLQEQDFEGIAQKFKQIFGTEEVMDQMSTLQKFNETLGVTKVNLENLAVNSFKKFEDALVSALMSGKAQFKDFADFVIEQLIRIAIQETIIKGITSLFTGGFNPASAATSSTSNFSNPFAGFFSQKATGGTVSSGRPYMVGEKGAELFVPSRTGTIVPNNQLGMAGGGVPVNITYQIQSFDSKDTLQAITENAPAISGIIEQQFNRRGKRGFTV